MRLGRLEISGEALLVIALLFYFDRDGLTPWLLLACFLHEMGHWCAIAAMGGKIKGIRLSCAGAELRLSRASPLSHRKLMLAALAGPLVNLLLAVGSALGAGRGLGPRLYLFSGLNLGLALFNLLPDGRLDGGRALAALLREMGREELAQKAERVGSFGVTALLLVAGGLLFAESGGRNFTVLLVGLWMWGTAYREEREEKI